VKTQLRAHDAVGIAAGNNEYETPEICRGRAPVVWDRLRPVTATDDLRSGTITLGDDLLYLC